MKLCFLLAFLFILSSCSTPGLNQSDFQGDRVVAESSSCAELVEGLLEFSTLKNDVQSLWKIFSENPDKFLKTYNDPRVARNLFKEIDAESLNQFIKTFNSRSLSWRVKNLHALEDLFSSIPEASEFFSLFDLFDLASIGKKGLQESVSFQDMRSSSKLYSKGMSEIDLKEIQSVGDFNKAAKKAFGFDYKARSSDVQMTTFKGEYELKVAPRIYENIARNNLLDVKKIISRKKSTEIEVVYFSIEHIEQSKSLFTKPQYEKIISMTDPEMATEYAVSTLLNSFFEPKKFKELVKTILPGHQYNAYSVYQAFISLHPFKDGNGRAARLYYRWLVTNHFPKESLNPHLLINEYDIFKPANALEDQSAFTWYATRLWVLAGKDDHEVIERSKKILTTESMHLEITKDLPYLMELLEK